MAERKLEIEANLQCPKCNGIPYRLYRRQVAAGSDIFEHVLWPGPDGSTPPPEDHRNLQCPNCLVALERK